MSSEWPVKDRRRQRECELRITVDGSLTSAKAVVMAAHERPRRVIPMAGLATLLWLGFVATAEAAVHPASSPSVVAKIFT